MHLIKVHFKYRVFVNCIALQSACRGLLVTGNGFASYFAWPCSFLSVSLQFERSVFFGQLCLLSSCHLIIGGTFQTLLLEGEEGSSQFGTDTESAL